jgi:ribosomal protein S11
MNKKKSNLNLNNKQLNKYSLKKKGHGIESAYLCITATSNNAILSLTNDNGGVIKQLSCGVSFKNTKKSAPFAFQSTLTKMIESIKDYGIFNIKLKIHTTGITHIREYLVGLADQGFNITKIIDLTSRNHNGVRKSVARKP